MFLNHFFITFIKREGQKREKEKSLQISPFNNHKLERFKEAEFLRNFLFKIILEITEVPQTHSFTATHLPVECESWTTFLGGWT